MRVLRRIKITVTGRFNGGSVILEANGIQIAPPLYLAPTRYHGPKRKSKYQFLSEELIIPFQGDLHWKVPRGNVKVEPFIEEIPSEEDADARV